MKLFRESIVNIPELILDESKYSHIYRTPDGRKFRSVTTMLNKTKSEETKKRLQEWQDRMGRDVAEYIMKTSASIGTETHKLNENYIRMEKNNYPYSLLAQAHHKKFIPYLNKISNIYGIEAKIYSIQMNLAGTADCIAEYNGKLCIIDYKTKRSKQRREWMDDYFIQTTAYARMWEELTGTNIEQLVLLVSSEQDTFQEFTSEPELYYDSLDQRLVMFRSLS